MKDARSISNIMNTICAKAFTDASTSFPTGSGGSSAYFYNFLPGTPNEINRRLSLLTKSSAYQNKRFPMIGMIYNFKQTSGQNGLYNSVPVTLWLMHTSDKQPNYEDRITNTFDVFLYPYWNAIRNRIRRSGYVFTDISKGVEYEVTERPDWGKYVAGLGNTAVKFGQNVEGLEIDLKLTFTDNNGFATNKNDKTIIQ